MTNEQMTHEHRTMPSFVDDLDDRLRRTAVDTARAPGPRSTATRRGPRRRPLALAAGVATVAAAVGVVGVVDLGAPGAFVDEADAQQVLRAAADATRDDPAPGGWRFTTTVRSDRGVYEGRRCGTCATERGVLENRRVVETWSGPRGETYTRSRFEPGRAVENAPLLRSVGADGHELMPGGATHRPPVTGDERSSPIAAFGAPETLTDPGAVPDEPDALVRWATERLRVLRRSTELLRDQSRTGRQIVSDETAISWDLVNVATAQQLTGRQQAAAFQALSSRPGVSVVETPAAFAGPDRVTIRIAAVPGEGADVPDPTDLDRFVVFDTATHRLVGESTPAKAGRPSSVPLVLTGKDGARVEQLVGSGGAETRYAAPVDVAGPGLDGDGKRLLDPADAHELGR